MEKFLVIASDGIVIRVPMKAHAVQRCFLGLQGKLWAH